jgi:hypothetical protein
MNLTTDEKSVFLNSHQFWCKIFLSKSQKEFSKNIDKLCNIEDIPLMLAGERRSFDVGEGAIIVNKQEGRVLKSLLDSRVFHNIPNDMKMMIINRQKDPLFLDKKNDELYFCDSPTKYPNTIKRDLIWSTGKYSNVICDTDPHNINIPSVYFILVYTKGNICDGTHRFIPTKELINPQELEIRSAQKQIIQEIVSSHRSPERKKKARIINMITTDEECKDVIQKMISRSILIYILLMIGCLIVVFIMY